MTYKRRRRPPGPAAASLRRFRHKGCWDRMAQPPARRQSRKFRHRKSEPRVAEVSGLPHAAVYRRHVKNVGLLRNAADGHGASAAKRPDAPPAHFGIKFRIVLLRANRKNWKRQPSAGRAYQRLLAELASISSRNVRRIARASATGKAQSKMAYRNPGRKEKLAGSNSIAARERRS